MKVALKKLTGFAVSTCLALAATIAANAQGSSPSSQQVDALLEQGHFRKAVCLLSNQMESVRAGQVLSTDLVYELDRIERIRKDYPLSESELFRQSQEALPKLSAREYRAWIAEGRFDCQEIDGTRRFLSSSVPNLFFRHPEIKGRLGFHGPSTSSDRPLLLLSRLIRREATLRHTPYVLPLRFEAQMTLRLKANAAPPGETVRAWLPIPRGYPHQTDFELLSSSPTRVGVDAEDSPIRSAYLEAPARNDLSFTVRYGYRTSAVYFDTLDGGGPGERDTEVAQNLAEAPHVQFTPEMRHLAERLTGNETHALQKARACYQWISTNIMYSFAREYSTVRNLGGECLRRGYGDCGEAAFVFITLCRISGVPARWQSGWLTYPGMQNLHDWAEIYLDHWGWIPVDPYMGVFAMRYASGLLPSEQLELRDFYFGGLDPYRMIANSDHNQQLRPSKRSPRSDPVDFQRGELEWGEHNIYFDQFSYSLAVKPNKNPQ